MIPQECLFEKDSIKVVYVFKNDKFSVQPVEPVHKNTEFVVIKSGLSGGEKLALREPSGSMLVKTDDD